MFLDLFIAKLHRFSTIKKEKGGIMIYFVKAMGIIVLVMGVVGFLKPQVMKSMIAFFKEGKRCYIVAAVRIVLGALFLYSVKFVTFPWIPGVVGVVAIASGLFVYAFGLVKVHAYLDKILNLPESKLRIFPTLGVVIGVLLIYSA